MIGVDTDDFWTASVSDVVWDECSVCAPIPACNTLLCEQCNQKFELTVWSSATHAEEGVIASGRRKTGTGRRRKMSGVTI